MPIQNMVEEQTIAKSFKQLCVATIQGTYHSTAHYRTVQPFTTRRCTTKRFVHIEFKNIAQSTGTENNVKERGENLSTITSINTTFSTKISQFIGVTWQMVGKIVAIETGQSACKQTESIELEHWPSGWVCVTAAKWPEICADFCWARNRWLCSVSITPERYDWSYGTELGCGH